MGLNFRTALSAWLVLAPFCHSTAWATAPGTAALHAAEPEKPAAEAPIDPSRLQHARELLGKHYQRSHVRAGETIGDISEFVHEAVSRRMKGEPQPLVRKVATTILKESRRHELDPLLIVAIIERESGFRTRIRGGVGEAGLMQILPTTGQWIARSHGIPWKGVRTLLDPVMNIRLGTLYLAMLREKLDADSRLYLAAYNMGIGNVMNLIKRNRKPRVYPERIMKSYLALYAELSQDLKVGGTAIASEGPSAVRRAVQ